MSMMNANAAATTAMTTNEPLDFVLPEMGDADFSSEELAEDTDGLTMSFPRIKIPAGGVLQFEIPNGDPQHPDYRPTLTGVILYNHASCAYCRRVTSTMTMYRRFVLRWMANRAMENPVALAPPVH